ncbi:hypothetical protein GCM10010518_30120 [Kitasatospora cinereorecta]
MGEGDVAALLGQQGQDRRHVAADGVPGHGQPCRVEPVGRALGGDPAGDRVALLHGHRMASLGGQVVLGEDDGGPGSDGQLPHEAVVGVGVAEHPAGSVDVEHDGQWPVHAHRPGDAGPDGSGRAALDGDPLLCDRGCLDGTGLHLVHGLAALDRAEVEQVRRVRRGLGEGGGRGFQYDRTRGELLGHGGLLGQGRGVHPKRWTETKS